MKKYALILMICILIMSMTSCKRMPEDTAGADIPAQGTQAETPESEKQQKPEDQPINPDAENKDNKDIAEDKPDGTMDKTNDADKENTEPTVQEDFTLDVPFSEYEVVVTLTDEETAKDKTYMPDDFPELDIFNVFEQPDYYDYKFGLEDNKYKGKTTIILMLNEPSKERVLEYIKILQKDERVFDACPSLDEFSTTSFFVKMKDESINYTESSFNYLDIGEFLVNKRTSFGSPNFYPNPHYGLGNDHLPIINI